MRWKAIDKQPIGWHPDLNEGVRLNIRPFITAQVLRYNKIAWEKDRGKDVESAPWYHFIQGRPDKRSSSQSGTKDGSSFIE